MLFLAALALVAFTAVVSLFVDGTFHRIGPLLRRARARRALRGPATPVQKLQPGLVRIAGHTRARGEQLQAPVTHRPCLAFSVVIEEATKGGLRERYSQRAARSFVVVDPTGEVVVEPGDHFELVLREDRAGDELAPDDGYYQRALQLLRQAGVSLRAADGADRSFHYREAVLVVGEGAVVQGRAVREPSPEGDRRSPRDPPERVVLRGDVDACLHIRDDRLATGALAVIGGGGR